MQLTTRVAGSALVIGAAVASLAFAGFVLADHSTAPSKIEASAPTAAAGHRTYATVGLGDTIIADQGSWYRLLTAGSTWLVDQADVGISNATTAQLRNRASAAIAMHPDVLVLEGGTDDFLRGIPALTTVSNLRAIVVEAQAAKVHVIISTVPPSNENPAAVGRINNAIRLVGLAQPGVTLVDGNGPIINPDGSYRAGMTTDRRHPTLAAYQLMADSIEKQLARTPYNEATSTS